MVFFFPMVLVRLKKFEGHPVQRPENNFFFSTMEEKKKKNQGKTKREPVLNNPQQCKPKWGFPH